ncbi:MAG: ubiquinol-cytochrome c reductase iron-sulfur subunit [Pseudomonadota bacterium]|nr:ubiquinol-cytochrome c reductase iron-sulfur subunit [Pseudomonadota bacterium]MEE2821295.1 ubiquinol-cytochrome c reductase iron-sulfur subunit [Pseudomonadota bacterium]
MSDAVIRDIQQSADTSRRKFLVGVTTTLGALGVVGVATPFVSSWNPSAKAKAAGAPVKVDISKILPGEQIRAEWRGKPVFVLRRTPEMLEAIKATNDVVADPNSQQPQQPVYAANEARAINAEIAVLVGICTHLGCSPQFRPEVGAPDLGNDWKGGYFCPCHGSKFDLAGRVYKAVPAPTNLLVPPHSYESDNVLIIGVDEETA